MGFPVGWTAWACLSFVDLCWECRTQSSTLRWKDLEASARSLHKYSHLKICSSCEILNLLLQFQWQVYLHQGVSNTVNLSNVTLAILGEAGQWVEFLLPCRDDSDWWIFVGCLGMMYGLDNLWKFGVEDLACVLFSQDGVRGPDRKEVVPWQVCVGWSPQSLVLSAR